MTSSERSGPVIDDATVQHVAHLARIDISDAEAQLYARQLSKILDYVAQLNELDTTDVPPSEHPHDASGVIRMDAVSGSVSPDAALSNAPDRHGDYFRVPKVLEQHDA